MLLQRAGGDIREKDSNSRRVEELKDLKEQKMIFYSFPNSVDNCNPVLSPAYWMRTEQVEVKEYDLDLV